MLIESPDVGNISVIGDIYLTKFLRSIGHQSTAAVSRIMLLPRNSSSLMGAFKMNYTKVHNSGLKNPKKCNIWHLPAKFGSTVAWVCMCFARICCGLSVNGPSSGCSGSTKIVKNCTFFTFFPHHVKKRDECHFFSTREASLMNFLSIDTKFVKIH